MHDLWLSVCIVVVSSLFLWLPSGYVCAFILKFSGLLYVTLISIFLFARPCCQISNDKLSQILIALWPYHFSMFFLLYFYPLGVVAKRSIYLFTLRVYSRSHRSIPPKRVFHMSFVLCPIKKRGIGEIISGIGGMWKLAHKSAVKQGHCMFLVIEMMFWLVILLSLLPCAILLLSPASCWAVCAADTVPQYLPPSLNPS